MGLMKFSFSFSFVFELVKTFQLFAFNHSLKFEKKKKRHVIRNSIWTSYERVFFYSTWMYGEIVLLHFLQIPIAFGWSENSIHSLSHVRFGQRYVIWYSSGSWRLSIFSCEKWLTNISMATYLLEQFTILLLPFHTDWHRVNNVCIFPVRMAQRCCESILLHIYSSKNVHNNDP